MKKITILITLISLITLKVFSQCNVKEYENDNLVSLENNFENIYTSSGNSTFQAFSIKLLTIRELNNPKSLTLYSIAVKSASDSPNKIIVPRGLYIKFDNNSFLDLDAKTILDTEVKDKLLFQTCSFYLSKEDVLKLKNNSIKFINIIDTRTQKYVQSLPYGELLKEQLNCLN